MQRIDPRDAADHESGICLETTGVRGIGIGDHESGQDEEHVHEKAIRSVPDRCNAAVDGLQMENENAESGNETIEVENDEPSGFIGFHRVSNSLRDATFCLAVNCDASSLGRVRRQANSHYAAYA